MKLLLLSLLILTLILGLEEKVKVGAKFGTSTTVQHRVSTTVTTYLDSDELQDVIVNFGDDIIIKNEMDSVGFTYCGRRGEYRCPIYEPALNLNIILDIINLG